MMSLKYIFQIIVQSYKLKRMSDSEFECQKFLGLMSLLRNFLIEGTGKKEQSKEEVQSRKYGFKNLFEIETLNIIKEILSAGDLIDILEDLLEHAKDTKDYETLTLNVMKNVIKMTRNLLKLLLPRTTIISYGFVHPLTGIGARDSAGNE